jgi:hypothetical protein
MDVNITGHDYIEEYDADIGDDIKKLTKYKAASIDKISVEVWKEFCSINDGVKTLTELFSKIKRNNHFLEVWKSTTICPTYK